MGILDGLFQDTVNIYDDQETLVHSSVKLAILPPKQGQANMTIEGPMYPTNPSLLAPIALTIPPRGLIEVVSSGMWAASTWFRVDGEAQKLPNPFSPGTAHHWQAGLIKENR